MLILFLLLLCTTRCLAYTYQTCNLISPDNKFISFDKQYVQTFTNTTQYVVTYGDAPSSGGPHDWSLGGVLQAGESIAPICVDTSDWTQENPTCMANCLPYGTTSCYGNQFYVLYYGNATSSSCYCYYAISGDFVHYRITDYDNACLTIGQEQYTNACSFTCRNSTIQQIAYDQITCADLPTLYEQYTCNVHTDATYYALNEATLKTYTLQNFEPIFQSTSIDRVYGYLNVTIANYASWENQTLHYQLDFHDGKFYSGWKYVKKNPFIIGIDNEHYFSISNITLTINTTDTWVLGKWTVYTFNGVWYPDIAGFNALTEYYVDVKAQNQVLLVMTSIGIAWGSLVLGGIFLKNNYSSLSRMFLICMFLICMCSNAEANLGCSSPNLGSTQVETIINGEKVFRVNGAATLTNINGDVCFNLFDDEGTSMLQIKLTLVDVYMEYPLVFQYSSFSWDEATVESKLDCGAKLEGAFCKTTSPGKECENYYNCNDYLEARTDGEFKTFFDKNRANQILDFSCVEGTRSELDCNFHLFMSTNAKAYKKVKLLGKQFFKVFEVQESNLQEFATVKVEIDFLNGTISKNEIIVDGASPSAVVPFTSVQNMEFYNLGLNIQSNLLNTGQATILQHSHARDNAPGSSNNFWFTSANAVNTFTIGNVGSIQCLNNFTECQMNPDYCVDVANVALQHSCNGGISELKQFLDLKMGERIGVQRFASGDEFFMKMQADNKEPSALIRKKATVTGLDIKFSGLAQVGDILLSTKPVCKLVSDPIGCKNCDSGFSFVVEIRSLNTAGNVEVSSDSTDSATRVSTSVLYITTEPKQVILRGFTGNEDNEFNVIFASSTDSCSVKLAFKAFTLDKLKPISFSTEDGIAPRDKGIDNPFDGLGQAIVNFFKKAFEFIGSIFSFIFDIFEAILDFFLSLFGLSGRSITTIILILLILCLCGPAIIACAPELAVTCCSCCFSCCEASVMNSVKGAFKGVTSAVTSTVKGVGTSVKKAVDKSGYAPVESTILEKYRV